ncbi:MAG: type II secretion system GspH family protein [Puniceicoccales bacterium]|nr:type II secretion system GspH family protein [Puniceicoccales bacterium]
MGVEHRSGFTLVELLVAMAVIGILVSMLVPATSRVMEQGRRTKGANAVAQIAKAYLQFSSMNGEGTTINPEEVDTVGEWAVILAKAGLLNDVRMYLFPDDTMATKITSKIICKPDGSVADSNFTNAITSICVAAGVPAHADPSITPIAWTRGLGADGKWDTTGIYGNKGGYIGFLDGHVEWFSDLGTGPSDGKLVNSGTGTPTNNIAEALGGGVPIPTLRAMAID